MRQNSLDENALNQSRHFDEQEVSMNIFPEDKEAASNLPKDMYLKAAISEHESSKNMKNYELSKNLNSAATGKLGNGHNMDPDTITTRNVNGLQTTEI